MNSVRLGRDDLDLQQRRHLDCAAGGHEYRHFHDVAHPEPELGELAFDRREHADEPVTITSFSAPAALTARAMIATLDGRDVDPFRLKNMREHPLLVLCRTNSPLASATISVLREVTG